MLKLKINFRVQLCLIKIVLLLFLKKPLKMSFINECQSETVEVAGFIAKTFDILNTSQYSKIIYWAPNGKEFIIKDINKFQQVILPKFFRHNKINSFIRQLNMYGFHKSRKENSKSVFSHPLFQKDREDLLSEIKRKIKQNQNEENQICMTPTKNEKMNKMQSPLTTAGKQILQTKDKINESKNFGFMENIGSSFRQLFQSKEIFSRQNLNFSLEKFSQNYIGENFYKEQNKKDLDVISIENGIQEQKQREKQITNLPSFINFQNPTCFFNSFILKDGDRS